VKQLQNLLILFPILLFSCKTYKQDILFNIDENTTLQKAVYDVERNYTIKPNDLLEIQLYTNNGQEAIDPNYEFPNGNLNQNRNSSQREEIQYLVRMDGKTRFPEVGDVEVSGLTIDEAEEILESLYNEFYKRSFVKLKYANKRVTVLGSASLVIPLENENTSLLEVLSLSEGIPFGSLGNSIRVIRGDLTNPEVFVVDLTTISTMQSTMISIHPGDVIYIEPWRRPWIEAMKDLTPMISLITSALTLALLIVTLNQP
jgi:polysaccharide export outer membrane protein